MFALAMAASVIASRDARAQPIGEVETSQDPTLANESDASADNAIEVETRRVLQAEHDRLEAEIAEKEKEIAALEEEAKHRRARHVEKPSLGAGLAMAALSVVLAAVASRLKTNRRSRGEASPPPRCR
jgi:flagellar motility protein MotE (MotC chaperone)